jgi:hypothetical protein
MSAIRITSASGPFLTPDLVRQAVGIISKADAMGLLSDLKIQRLDLPSFRAVVGKIAEAGIGTEVQAALSAPEGRLSSPELSRLLDRLEIAIEESPSPEHEWRALDKVFSTDRLASLLGTSSPSVRRYCSGARSTPDALAARLHYLATIVGDLAGAYNEIGIRRWFDRQRSQLEGRAPTELLQGDWSPEDPGPLRLRELARSLTASPAT